MTKTQILITIHHKKQNILDEITDIAMQRIYGYVKQRDEKSDVTAMLVMSPEEVKKLKERK